MTTEDGTSVGGPAGVVAVPDRGQRPALLRCVHVGGTPRYDLPAVRMGGHAGYDIYWRGAPVAVVHHGRGERILLPHSEFVLVGVGLRRCISVSVDDAGFAQGAYVNINLEPVLDASGWCWQDLELDVKLALSYGDRWVPMVLDWEDFQAANLSAAHRALAVREVGAVLKAVEIGQFPFSLPRLPWLGLFRQSELPLP